MKQLNVKVPDELRDGLVEVHRATFPKHGQSLNAWLTVRLERTRAAERRQLEKVAAR